MILVDRKGIHSEDGVADGFKKAIQQGCGVVVIDLNTNFKKDDKYKNKSKDVNIKRLKEKIYGRYRDFLNGSIVECIVVLEENAVRIDKSFFVGLSDIQSKNKIEDELNKLARKKDD